MEQGNKNSSFLSIKTFLSAIFNITSDKACDDVINQRVCNDIEMKGSNLWVLIFAIFIASIGLNVNSTAVIIGAMLISPLMGPIIGIGYSAGINDFGLLRKSFKNILIATIIALLTSTLYFKITPLDIAQSELLARTSPNIWDVLIALFGGLAGILGITRQEKSNVIPGVAIATALMPPLCTAGFGLATSNMTYFLGAFYLFTINFVFIAFSAFIFVRFLNISEKKYIDVITAKKAHIYIAIIVLITMLPSLYLASIFVSDEIFKVSSKNFVSKNFNFDKTSIAKINIDTKTKTIKVYLIGEHVSDNRLKEIDSRLGLFGLEKANLKIYQNDSATKLDLLSIKSEISKEVFDNLTTSYQIKNQEIEAMKSELANINKYKELCSVVPKEASVLFPKLKNIILSQALISDDNNTKSVLILNSSSKYNISGIEKEKIIDWLKIRTNYENIEVFISKI